MAKFVKDYGIIRAIARMVIRTIADYASTTTASRSDPAAKRKQSGGQAPKLESLGEELFYRGTGCQVNITVLYDMANSASPKELFGRQTRRKSMRCG